MLKVKKYDIEAADVSTFTQAGCNYSLDELIDLSRRRKIYRVDVEFAKMIKAAGHKLTVDELIKINQYKLTPKEFSTFQKAGYSLAEMFKAKAA